MKRLGFILLILGLAISCSTLPDSSPVYPDQAEMDSHMTIYGQSIFTKDLDYLHHFKIDSKGNTLLYGGSSDNFWFGSFKPDRSKIKEHLIKLDVEDKFIQPKSVLPGIDFQVMDKLIFEVFTSESDIISSASPIGRSIMGLSESIYELYHLSDYFSSDDLYILNRDRKTPSGSSQIFIRTGWDLQFHPRILNSFSIVFSTSPLPLLKERAIEQW